MDDSEPKVIVADGVEIPTTQEALDENVGQKIIGGGIWRLVAYGFATLASIVSTAIISRELGPADFGAFTTALSLVAIGSAVADLGLLQLGIREYAAQQGNERDRNLRALITLRLIASSLAAVVIAAIGVRIVHVAEAEVGMVLAAVSIVIFSLSVSYSVPLYATYRLNVVAALDALRQGLVSALMVVAVLATASVSWVIGTYLPVAIVLLIATVLVVRREVPLSPSFDKPAMLGLVKAVGVFTIAASVGAIYAYVAQVVSHAVLDPDAAGQFALAFRIFSVLVGGAIAAVGGAFPLLVTSSKDDVERMIYASRRLLQTTFLAGVASTVALVTGAGFAIAVLGGSEFDDAIDLVAIVGLALPFSFVLITGSTILLATGRHRELVFISVAGALSSIALTAFLAYEFDEIGAAVGLVFGEALICSGYLFVLARIDRRVFPTRGWVAGVVVAGVVGSVAALLPVYSLVAAAFGSIAFLLVAAALRLLPPELEDLVPPLKLLARRGG